MQTRIPRPRTNNEEITDTELTTLPVAPNVQDTLTKAKKVLEKEQKVKQKQQQEQKVYKSCGC